MFSLKFLKSSNFDIVGNKLDNNYAPTILMQYFENHIEC